MQPIFNPCKKYYEYICKATSQVMQLEKNLLPVQGMQETPIQSLGWEDSLDLEEEMATYSTILAWKIPWSGKPDGLQPMGSQRVGHN